LQYLKATHRLRLVYNGYRGTEFCGFSDSDWASDPNSRCSTTGYIFQINGGTIAWATQKQRTIALSSTEAEYMALAECSKHAIWSIQLLQNLKIKLDLPITIYDDSKGACDIAKNNVFHKKTKHIEIKYHFTCEKIQDGWIHLEEIDSSENVADVFMKSLANDTHW
jgi:hypothetical protein